MTGLDAAIARWLALPEYARTLKRQDLASDAKIHRASDADARALASDPEMAAHWTRRADKHAERVEVAEALLALIVEAEAQATRETAEVGR